MHETGIESHYALVDGKKLRYGYTTGTCAAAAAKAATLLLLGGVAPKTVRIDTPKGITLDLEVLEPKRMNGEASCAIRKSSGDDPDVTDGVLVYATVRALPNGAITVDGGRGVGRVTKPGLKQPVGAAAINPGPMQMIVKAIEDALSESEQATGIAAVISIPEGEALAEKTFNPRLGIEGGISILGTSGIVEPMSESALIDSIRLEIRQRRALGQTRLILTPGNYGADYLKALCGMEDGEIVKCSNFIGRALDMAAEEGFPEVLLVGHVGKLCKLAVGVMNTHSKEGDARAELMAACALRAGASADTARAMLDCVTTDDMLRVAKDAGIFDGTVRSMRERIAYHLAHRVKGQFTIGVLVFSDVYGTLCSIDPADAWIAERKERKG